MKRRIIGLCPPHQRTYVASHPLGLLFSLGIAVTGFMALVAPGLFEDSSSTVVLSEWIKIIFNASWCVGGALSFLGILRGHRASEAVGMSLLGGGLLSYYSIIASLVPNGWLTGCFLFFLGVGCFLRARHVSKSGYVRVEVRRDAGSY